VTVGGDALLAVENLAKSFGGVHAVDGVSFEIPRGSLTGMIGPNGAGKSTVLGMVAGAIKPDRGSIRLGGDQIAGLPSYKTAQRGIIRTFQAASVFPHMTVLENLLLGAPPWQGEKIWSALFLRRRWRREQEAQVTQGLGLLDRRTRSPVS
jgi:ABC-type branched-subunit amino acid transport system ATPase component